MQYWLKLAVTYEGDGDAEDDVAVLAAAHLVAHLARATPVRAALLDERVRPLLAHIHLLVALNHLV